MIRIALCDDKPEDLEQIQKRIEQYWKNEKISEDLVISRYVTSSQMWYEIQGQDVADIFILDVDMPNMNGFELAEKIRLFHPRAAIIFLTVHSEYAAEGYKVSALRYIDKLNLDRDFEEALDAAVARIEKDKRAFIAIRHLDEIWDIAYSDILYVRRVMRRLEIYTTAQTLRHNDSLAHFFARLNDNRFTFIERSCFVNMDYVYGISGFQVILTDQQRLMASRRYVARLKTELLERWNNQKRVEPAAGRG